MKKILNNEKEYLEYAKERVSSAIQYLYCKEADFSDMSNVLVIQNYQYNKKIKINISVNFEDKKIHYFANDIEYLEERFDSIEEMLYFRLDDVLGHLYYNIQVYRFDIPLDDLEWCFKQYGYAILQPEKEIIDNEIRLENYEEKCHGSIPYGTEILGSSPDYMLCLPDKSIINSMVDGDIVVIHGDGKIYTFQRKNNKFIFVDNFFKVTMEICYNSDTEESCFFEESLM